MTGIWRKTAAFALAGALALLTACGGGGGTPETVEPTPVDGPETEAAAEPEAVRTPERAAPAGDAVRPALGLTGVWDGRYDDDFEMTVNSTYVSYAVPDADTRAAYPALAEALDRLGQETLENSRHAYADRNETVDTDIEERGAEDARLYFPYYGKTRTFLRRADTQAVCAAWYAEEYSGGVHGMYGYGGDSFDTAAGERLTLDRLLSDAGQAAFNERVAAELDRLYPEEAPGHMVLDRELVEYSFTLEPDGITLWFNPYEIASYASGVLTVRLFFGRDGDLFNEAYDGRGSWWCTELPLSLPHYWEDDSGAVHTLEVWDVPDEYNPEDSVGFAFALSGGGADDRNVVEEEAYFYEIHPYFCHTAAGNFLMVQVRSDNDAEALYFYSLDGSGTCEPLYMTGPDGFWYPEEPPEDTDNWADYSSCQYALTDPQNLPLQRTLYLFGTWVAEGTWAFTPDGVELDGEYLTLSTHGEVPLTLKQDLDVYPVSWDNIYYVYVDAVTVPAGTEVRPLVTDGENLMFFQVDEPVDGLPPELADGPWLFGLSLDNPDEWPRTVGGVEEDDLFDGLLYAG